MPGWPAARGPRILTLAGNDLTIDVRARKTASSLARAGFSVIAIGVDKTGAKPRFEVLDGATLVRMTPSPDPRISARSIRLSRAELLDSIRYRVEIRRQRLNMRRRSFTALRFWHSEKTPQWAETLTEGVAASSRFLGVPRKRKDSVFWRVDLYLTKLRRAVRFGPRKAVLKAEQRFLQVLVIVYKILAKSPTRAHRHGSWRRDLPELHRYEAEIGPIVDALEPDLVHVHDVFHLGLGARAKARAAAESRSLRLVYDAHEYIAGLPSDPKRRAALTVLESEYIRHADAILTVSESLADLIEARYGRRPSIVMNAPDMDTMLSTRSIREVADVPESGRLLVYVGGIAPHRGAETLVEAMTHLPSDTYLVFVAIEVTAYISGILQTAKVLGLADRVRTVPYVASEAVVDYIRSADVSVIPLSRQVLNYEVALPNKLFQSIHASVPVVVSDNPEMARFVKEHGVGEVFAGGDARALAAAIRTVLDDPRKYSERLADPNLLESTSWRRQAENLVTTYRGLGVSAP